MLNTVISLNILIPIKLKIESKGDLLEDIYSYFMER
jgi:hypothetical protein